MLEDNRQDARTPTISQEFEKFHEVFLAEIASCFDGVDPTFFDSPAVEQFLYDLSSIVAAGDEFTTTADYYQFLHDQEDSWRDIKISGLEFVRLAEAGGVISAAISPAFLTSEIRKVLKTDLALLESLLRDDGKLDKGGSPIAQALNDIVLSRLRMIDASSSNPEARSAEVAFVSHAAAPDKMLEYLSGLNPPLTGEAVRPIIDKVGLTLSSAILIEASVKGNWDPTSDDNIGSFCRGFKLNRCF